MYITQSIYECVNPAMRQQTHAGGGDTMAAGGHPEREDEYGYDYSVERCQSPSEIPTLPLRGASRKTRNMMVEYASSQQSTMPASPNKATRF